MSTLIFYPRCPKCSDDVHPSRKTAAYFQALEQNMTTEVSEDLEKNIVDQYFIDDIKKLEILLNRDLSVWYAR